MLKFSTGLRNHMLVTGSFKNAMDLCTLRMYSGAVPATADAALGAAVLVCPVTNNSTATGLTFEATATDGVLSKTISEVWSGVNVADGTVTFFRLETAADDGTASTTQKRVQGTIAKVNADLLISDPILIDAAPQDIDNGLITLPTA